MASRRASPWSDLPSDLLGLVLLQLHSFADRVRVGAVCRPWRSGARLHPKLPPPMPWVALGDKACLDIVNNSVHKLNLTVPGDADCGGSVDNMLFLRRGGGGCFLADPFSGAVHPVPDLAFFLKEQTREEMLSQTCSRSVRVHKVLTPWPPGSSPTTPVVTALTQKYENGDESCRTTIFVCRAGTDTGVAKESYSTMSVDLRRVQDIAFFRGNLYALSTHDQLLTVEIGEGSSGNPAITGVKYAIKTTIAGSYDDFGDYDEDDYEIPHFIGYEGIRILPTKEAYLVESGDQLLKLNRCVIDGGPPRGTCRFSIYEADL
jgi:hypothetical protein